MCLSIRCVKRFLLSFVVLCGFMVCQVFSAEVHVGSLPGWVVRNVDKTIVPIFIRYEGAGFQLCLWKEEQGKKYYCAPQNYKEIGSWIYFGCSWNEKDNCFSVSNVEAGFINVALSVNLNSADRIGVCVKDAQGQACSYYGESANKESLYPWVFVGLSNNGIVKVDDSTSVLYIPVFLKASGKQGKFFLWANSSKGRLYCQPTFTTEKGVLYISCSWTNNPTDSYVELSPGLIDYANIVVILKQEELEFVNELYAEFDTSIGTVLSGISIGREDGSEVDNQEESSDNYTNSANLFVVSNKEDYNNPFLSLLKGKKKSRSSSGVDVWDGTVNNVGGSENQEDEESKQTCVSDRVDSYPTRVSVSVGESRKIKVGFKDNCGNQLCVEEFSVEEKPEWISVEKSDCNLLFSVRAPNNPQTAEVKFRVNVGNFTDHGFKLTVSVLASGGEGVKLEEGKWYYFDFSPHEVKNVYFYACVSEDDKVLFNVAESSYYHHGVVEVIAKFLGETSPTSGDYPTWEDYYTIASYLFVNVESPRKDWQAKMLNLCPQKYYSPWTDWYGAINQDYSQYFYCMGRVLTRTLSLTAPPGEEVCGWWAVTLFNNSDESRSHVRVWFR